MGGQKTGRFYGYAYVIVAIGIRPLGTDLDVVKRKAVVVSGESAQRGNFRSTHMVKSTLGSIESGNYFGVDATVIAIPNIRIMELAELPYAPNG